MVTAGVLNSFNIIPTLTLMGSETSYFGGLANVKGVLILSGTPKVKSQHNRSCSQNKEFIKITVFQTNQYVNQCTLEIYNIN